MSSLRINDASKSINDASMRISDDSKNIIDNSRVRFRNVASLTIIICNRNMFIVQATPYVGAVPRTIKRV